MTSDAVLALTNASPSSGPLTLPMSPMAVGSSISLTASFQDAGSNDTHTAMVEWGDLSSTGATVSESNGAGTVTAGHTYTSPGVYTVRLLVPDDEGVVEIEQFQFVVIYDANGGFVTGGGWITSPTGAYPVNPGLGGKANLGFVSKYQKGSSVPSGHTEFQFQAAGFEFESASYDWLVIAGARAQYKGLGRVNGTGDYGFLLTATDGQVSGGGGLDRFRLKVWDRGTGTVVYDSQLGDADDAEPVTTLGGGSIVVHKK